MDINIDIVISVILIGFGIATAVILYLESLCNDEK